MNSVVSLRNCLFKQTGHSKRAVFDIPLSLDIKENQRWAITGNRKVSLLQVLAGLHVADPPTDGRTYPFLHKRAWPSQVIQHIEFGNTPVKATHLSARYEHFRDEFDQTMGEMLQATNPDKAQIQKVIELFELGGLENRWAVGLSNGQTRRFRLARALLKNPLLLLIDEPFLGLDPQSRQNISHVLSSLPPSPHVILGLRYQDEFPDWITHVAIISDSGILQGTLSEVEPVFSQMRAAQSETATKLREQASQATAERRDHLADSSQVIHLNNVTVSYRGEPVLKDLTWEVKKGERWHLRGENGSGKSTLLSLLTADHPQSWNSRISLFGEPRKTGKHNYFDINDQIGHCSPEIHSIFPGRRTVYQSISTGYVSGSFIPPTELALEQSERINSLIDQFGLDGETRFQDLSVSDQKTVLFLRAIVKYPKILILDEAFSTMDEARIAQCKSVVDNLNDTTVIAISHIQEEIPLCDKYIQLRKNGYEIGHV